MRSLLLATGLSVLFLNGCSLFPSAAETSTDKAVDGVRSGVISERGHSVDVLRPTSDVAGIVPGRRHTFGYPNKYNRVAAKQAPSNVEKKVSVVASNNKPKSLWDRYCTGEYISEQSEALLDSQPTPEKWIGRCRPIK